jgi:hypothetical protein
MQTIHIGRSDSCDIILKDDFVSRKHAELIVQDNGQVMIKDTQSSNGTFVNGGKVVETVLKPGDQLNCAGVAVNWEQYIPVQKLSSSIPAQKLPEPAVIQPEPEAVVVPVAEATVPEESTPVASQTESTSNLVATAAFWGALMVICGFFLPWERLFGLNGANIAQFVADAETDSDYSILFYLFPVSAGIFVLSALSGRISAFASAIRHLPMIMIIVFIIILISKLESGGGGDDEQDFSGSFFQIIGIGLILTIIGSIMMTTSLGSRAKQS